MSVEVRPFSWRVLEEEGLCGGSCWEGRWPEKQRGDEEDDREGERLGWVFYVAYNNC